MMALEWEIKDLDKQIKEAKRAATLSCSPLNQEEFENLGFQFGTSSRWGGRRYFPYVFTEQGGSMLFAVLQGNGWEVMPT